MIISCCPIGFASHPLSVGTIARRSADASMASREALPACTCLAGWLLNPTPNYPVVFTAKLILSGRDAGLMMHRCRLARTR